MRTFSACLAVAVSLAACGGQVGVTSPSEPGGESPDATDVRPPGSGPGSTGSGPGGVVGSGPGSTGTGPGGVVGSGSGSSGSGPGSTGSGSGSGSGSTGSGSGSGGWDGGSCGDEAIYCACGYSICIDGNLSCSSVCSEGGIDVHDGGSPDVSVGGWDAGICYGEPPECVVGCGEYVDSFCDGDGNWACPPVYGCDSGVDYDGGFGLSDAGVPVDAGVLPP